MNSIHDCGGMEGLGPILYEREEPVFRAEWERRVFGLVWATGAHGFWNLDQLRHAIERMPAHEYLVTPYYEHWLHGMETLLVEKGVVRREELLAMRGRSPKVPSTTQAVMTSQLVAQMVPNGFPARKPDDGHPRFRPGDRVRTRNSHPPGHTRLPRYARGKAGIVESDHGVYPFPDRNAHGAESAQHLYLVKFSAQEIWGERVSEQDSLCLGLWEDHLLPEESTLTLPGQP